MKLLHYSNACQRSHTLVIRSVLGNLRESSNLQFEVGTKKYRSGSIELSAFKFWATYSRKWWSILGNDNNLFTFNFVKSQVLQEQHRSEMPDDKLVEHMECSPPQFLANAKRVLISVVWVPQIVVEKQLKSVRTMVVIDTPSGVGRGCERSPSAASFWI